MLSYKETATFVLESLIKQGKLASTNNLEDNGPRCRYRLQDGDQTLKCAAGQCIPDEDYKPEFEGRQVYRLEVECDYVIKNHQIVILEALQILHDRLSMKTKVDHIDYLHNTLSLVNNVESDEDILEIINIRRRETIYLD